MSTGMGTPQLEPALSAAAFQLARHRFLDPPDLDGPKRALREIPDREPGRPHAAE
jgi:hypothetical protein